MKYSTVRKSGLNEEFRIDAEFYSPENLVKEEAITKHQYKLLGNICELIAGPFGSTVTTDRYDPFSDKRYIRGKDIQSFFIDKSDAIYIENVLFNKLTQFHLQEGDILLTVVGMKFGKVAIVYPDDIPALFSCKSTLLRNPQINVWYLLAYLSCDVGYGLIRRGQRGAAQPGINLFDIYHVPVPIFSEDFQLQIESLVKQASSFINKSVDEYDSAENILLDALMLANWKPKHQLYFINNYLETEQAERIDAEYFQPKYEEVVNAVKNYSGGWDTLGRLCETKRGSMISDVFYDENQGVPYIRGADFSGGQLTQDKLIFINNNFTFENETKVTEGEIVFSLIGSVGETALVTNEYSGAYISNNTGKITCGNNINPIVLQVLLKSIVGRMYFDKYKTQTAQPKISDKDIHNFVLPILEKDKQSQIIKKVTASFKLRGQSNNYLSCAKKALDIAIEQNEQAASDWLEMKAGVVYAS